MIDVHVWQNLKESHQVVTTPATLPPLTLEMFVESLTSWLQFENACGRSLAFDEHYLRSAIIQLLLPRFGERVRCESAHRVLKRSEVDFEVAGCGKGNVEIAIEAKWLDKRYSQSKSKVTRMVADIFRLELIARNHHCSNCWLIVGGAVSRFERLFNLKGRRCDSKRNLAVARRFLPPKKDQVGLYCGDFRDQKSEIERRTIREFVTAACGPRDRNPLWTCQLGKSFVIEAIVPFGRLCRESERWNLALPPYEFLVCGWRIFPADRDRLFVPKSEFMDVAGT